MNNTAEVYLWGTRIGIIHQDILKPYASFEYDKDFIKSGIEVSPLRMPLTGNVYEFPGMAVTEQWLTSLEKSGRKQSPLLAAE